MTATMKRDRLISPLSDADSRKVSALYLLLEDDINEHVAEHGFTEEQVKIPGEPREAMLSGKDKNLFK
jgi:hypothetical protein